MNIKEVKDLIQEILRSDIREFELEHTGTKVKLRRGMDTTPPTRSITSEVPPPELPSQPPEESPRATPKAQPGLEDGLHFITSPIVGTFYRAPSPSSEPYVDVGDTVDEGAILCVVEAMKLMNEIPSDIAGEVVRIYVETNHPVEFGQKLFGIRPRQ